MSLKFNLNRPKISDEEIDAHRDFDSLVKKFKAESLKKARGDESWWKDKKITYSAVIAGLTVVCTITYLSIKNNKSTQNQKHETLITQNKSTNTSTTKFIQAPNKKLNIPYHQYKVDNSKGASLQHPSKSKINIPKNCFVDKNGQNIVGEVTIQYREFNGIHEIIASGIPMAYDSAKQHLQLESAGMFEIKGFQNNQPVFIQKNKNIQVQYASDMNEDRFNQYFLDTIQRNWQYLKRDNISNSQNNNHQTTIGNTKKIETLSNEINHVLPKKIDSVKLVYNKKIEILPKASKPLAPNQSKAGRPVFQIDRDAEDFPELSAFDNVVFEVGEENKNYSTDLHDVTWSDLKITQGPAKGKNYWLNLSYRNKKVSLIVYPVFSGVHYQKALNIYQEKLTEYETLQNKRLAEEKRLVAEMELKQANYLKQQKEKQIELENERKKLLAEAKNQQINQLNNNFKQMNSQTKTQRIFEVFNFGIYNSDCAKPLPNQEPVKPMFVSIESQSPLLPDMVYLVNKTQSTVLGLSREKAFEFAYQAGDDYLICVFQKNDIFMCDPSSFKTCIENDKHQFLVSSITQQSQNLNEFKKALSL